MSAGYSSLTPRTVEGKIVTMAYAIVGVPLMLMFLSSLGRVLADSIRRAYAKICFRPNRHQKCATEDTDEADDYYNKINQKYQSTQEKNKVKSLYCLFPCRLRCQKRIYVFHAIVVLCSKLFWEIANTLDIREEKNCSINMWSKCFSNVSFCLQTQDCNLCKYNDVCKDSISHSFNSNDRDGM